MIPSETIREIQYKLQSVEPNIEVLLGGSYAYNEAQSESDIDFYVIVQSINIFKFLRLRKAIAAVKDAFFTYRLNIMVVPQIFFAKGWYYIYGINTVGATVVSAFNREVVVQNSLKLGLFNFLKSIVAQSPYDRRIALLKSAQQLAAYMVITREVVSLGPLFSLRRLVQSLAAHSREPELEYLLVTKLNGTGLSNEEIATYSQWIGSKIAALAKQETVKIPFSFANWALYNIKFLLFGRSACFLFLNPDKKIINELLDSLRTFKNLNDVYKKMERIVFPALII